MEASHRALVHAVCDAMAAHPDINIESQIGILAGILLTAVRAHYGVTDPERLSAAISDLLSQHWLANAESGMVS